MLARISTAALLAILMTGTVQAQTSPAPDAPPATLSDAPAGAPAVPSPASTVQLNFYTPEPADMLVSALPGTQVYNLQNEEIGVIEDLLIDESRNVQAFVIRTLVRPTAQTAANTPAAQAKPAEGNSQAVAPKGAGAGATTGSTGGEGRLVAMAADSVIFARQPDGSMRPVVNTTAAGLRNAPEFKFEGRFARKR